MDLRKFDNIKSVISVHFMYVGCTLAWLTAAQRARYLNSLNFLSRLLHGHQLSYPKNYSAKNRVYINYCFQVVTAS